MALLSWLGTTFVALTMCVLTLGPRQQLAAKLVNQDTTAHILQYPNLTSSLWLNTLDPAIVTDVQAQMVLQMLYGNLVKLDAQNRVIPDLAQSWTISFDRRTYTFHLRHTSFSDGTPVTADDVIYSIDRALNPKVYLGKSPSPVAPIYLGAIVGATSYTGVGVIAGLKQLNPLTVQIILSRPVSYFLAALTYPTAFILRKGHTPIGSLTTTDPLAHQISSGPWSIASFRYRSSLSFVPNHGYYNAARLRLQRIEMPFVPDADTLYSGYESGQFDMCEIPSAHLVRDLHLSDAHSTPSLAVSYIVYNFAKPPFNNRALRLATSYAIDRDLINNVVLHGEEKSLYSIVPEGISGYDAMGKQYTPHFDPVLARRYLTEAKRELGARFPTSITIRFGSSAGSRRLYTNLQYEWKRIGLNVQPIGVDYNALQTIAVKPTTSITYTGGDPWLDYSWGADYADAQDFTTNLLTPSSAVNIGNYESVS